MVRIIRLAQGNPPVCYSILALFFWFHPALGQDGAPSLLPQALTVLKPRSIGPASMSGRIVDVAVYEKEPRIMYVASATGGLWKTTNNGATWKPVFEREGTISLGAVAVATTDPDILWVGTGEANPRNSVSSGDGVYRSLDGGKSWKQMGLKKTFHIGRIVIHPTRPEIVYVAALGKLWAANDERGLFKTMNGGDTWECVHRLDANTGFVDLVMDPVDPEVLYAAAYQVRRDAFSGGNPATQTGPRAGLYKTSDGGKTWTKLANGLPDRPLGRCGLAVSRKNTNIVYAVVQTDKTSATVQGQAAGGKLNPDVGGIFRSEDHGQTWRQVNTLCPRPFYYGQIRVDPNDEGRIYVLGIQCHLSRDGGKTFVKENAAPGTHVDYHALWINPRDSHHLVLGSDGGLNFSQDRGQTWEVMKNLPVAQFYAIGLDNRKPYRVYGGLQDNGSWGGPSATRDAAGIGLHEWFNILGYDGYYCQVDPNDVDTVYCEGQYGILRRVNVKNGLATDIKPRLDTKGQKTNLANPLAKSSGFRFNWCSPILLSPHQSQTVYFGGNVLFRSDNRGESWHIVSPDLTRGKPGPSDYQGHTITTLAESPKKKGLLFVGTDDGRIHVSTNAGKDWIDLSEKIPDLPQDRWITRLECSHDEATRVYLAIDRHRNDDRGAFLFRSEDQGQTWKSLTANLKNSGPIHVIREDPRSPRLLYVGAEHGLFISLDGGATWDKSPSLPNVPVHDLAIHTRDRELVLGTHGRGIYIMDVAPLQQMAAWEKTPRAYLFEVRDGLAYPPRVWKNLDARHFTGENPPLGVSVGLFLGEEPSTPPVLTIMNGEGQKVAELKGTKRAGLQRIPWRMMRAGAEEGAFRPVPAGIYTATFRDSDRELRRQFQVIVEE